MNTIEIRKEKITTIKKANGIENQKAKVVLVLDFSGSMRSLYTDGTVDSILERLLPVAMAFDDDQKIDLYLFSNICIYIGELGESDISGISAKLMRKYNMNSTKYANPIDEIIKETVAANDGKPATVPTYVIFVTDGENDLDDKRPAMASLIEASKHSIFFQFVGIGSAKLEFLEKLDTLTGRTVDNANFFQITNINEETDDSLYQKLMNEFPTWLAEARTKNILV